VTGRLLLTLASLVPAAALAQAPQTTQAPPAAMSGSGSASVSTGAAPGYIAVRLGKLLGARTAWIDSVANVEEVSLSGRMVGRHADLWLTQWRHLAKDDGPQYRGEVL